jgi:hypothetical protein
MPMFKSIPDSAVAYYADFRSGTILDFTRVNTLAYYFPGTYNYQFGVTGIKLNNADMAVQTADTAALTLDGSIIVGMQAVVPITANKVLVGYRTNAGVNKGELSVNKTAISFYDGVTSSTYTATVPFGKRSVGVSWATGTTAKFYLDGVLFGAGTLNNASLALTDLFCVGRANADNSGLPGTYSWVVKTTRVLTSTEMSVLTSELQDRRFPTRSSSRFTCDLGVNSLAPNLIWAPCLNKPAINGIVSDVSPTGSNASIVGVTQPTFENDALGGGFKFNGANGFTATGTAFTKVNNFTVTGIIKPNNVTGYHTIISQNGRWILYAHGTNLNFLVGSGHLSTGLTLQIGNTYFVAAVVKIDGSIDFYCNGVFLNNVASVAIGGGSGVLQVGHYSTIEWFNGKIYRAEIYSKALSAAEIKTAYSNSGLLQISESSGWGSPVSTAIRGGVAGQYLETTRWAFGTTTPRYKIDVSAINGKTVKTISCTTAGPIKKATDSTWTPQMASYGTFEFSFYKGADANAPDIYLVSSTGGVLGDGVVNGYCFRVSNLEVITLVRVTAGNSVATIMTIAPAISNTTWYRVRVTRDFAGNWKMYLLGGTYLGWTLVGSSAAPDNTHTSSYYQTLNLNALDLVSLGTVDGEFAYTSKPFM